MYTYCIIQVEINMNLVVFFHKYIPNINHALKFNTAPFRKQPTSIINMDYLNT